MMSSISWQYILNKTQAEDLKKMLLVPYALPNE